MAVYHGPHTGLVLSHFLPPAADSIQREKSWKGYPGQEYPGRRKRGGVRFGGSGKLEGAGLSSGTAHSLLVSASWEWLVKLRRGHRKGSVVFLAKCSSSLQALGGGLGEGVQRD